MAQDKTLEPGHNAGQGTKGEQRGSNREGQADEPRNFKVEDRRHWQLEEPVEADEAAAPHEPSFVEACRRRAEAAEQKLQEYIEAFKSHQREQDEVRLRLSRDVDRKVELKFGELVGELLSTVDDLDLSLSHVQDVPEARPLAEGVAMARNGFLTVLVRHGVSKISPEGAAFDPNEAEAVRVDPVDSPDGDGLVTEIFRPGYRLGDRVIRPARVAVGRYTPKS